MKLLTFIVGLALVIASLSCHNVVQSTEVIFNSSTATTKLHFPEPWLDERDRATYIEEIEVRRLPNSPADEFLFGALPEGSNFYAYEVDKNLPQPRYGKNFFAVNFAGGPQVRVATQQEWESGSRIRTMPRSIGTKSPDYWSGEIEYRQKHYSKPGKYWGLGRLSPSGRWLAAFSYSGEKRPPDFLFGGGDVPKGDAFLQIHDTATGQKVFEWEAKNVKDPAHFNSPVIWLEDRYFLFPEDELAQNYIVVNLPPVTPEANPVRVQFPSRRAPSGERLPAGARNEVWIPLVPLTKEQAAKLTAPYDTEIDEVRISSTAELMFAIKEETENRRVNRQQRDGSGEYHFKVVSTYYYALSLDNLTQTRFATKEEWERAQKVRSYRGSRETAPAAKTVKGPNPPYREFPRTGITWGSPALLTAGEWIAIFSYNRSREMFVDVYDQRVGDKLSSTSFPITVDPNELFKNATWIEGGYILLPLNASLDSFAFWQLPGGI